MGLSTDETRFLAAISMVGMRYPKDVWPDHGTSPDAKAAKFARTICDEVWKEYQKLKEQEADQPNESHKG